MKNDKNSKNNYPLIKKAKTPKKYNKIFGNNLLTNNVSKDFTLIILEVN